MGTHRQPRQPRKNQHSLQQPQRHLVLQSAAQTTIVRMELAKTGNAFPTRPLQTQPQLQQRQHLVLQSVVQMTTAKKDSSARTASARSLAPTTPTAGTSTQSATKTTTTANTAPRTTSAKMVALLTQTVGRACPAALLLTVVRRSATQPSSRSPWPPSTAPTATPPTREVLSWS